MAGETKPLFKLPSLCRTIAVRWKGVSFRSLPKQRQKNFEKYSVPCIIIEKDTDRDVVFSIYRDINSGDACRQQRVA